MNSLMRLRAWRSQTGSGSGLEAIAILRASYELGRHLRGGAAVGAVQ
jgi:hypothetical protein